MRDTMQRRAACVAETGREGPTIPKSARQHLSLRRISFEVEEPQGSKKSMQAGPAMGKTCLR